MKRPADVELTIDEVVLHGFPDGARALFSDVLKQALLRELGSPRLQRSLVHGGDVRYVDGGPVRFPAEGTPHDLGGAVARSVSRSLLTATKPPGGRVR